MYSGSVSIADQGYPQLGSQAEEHATKIHTARRIHGQRNDIIKEFFVYEQKFLSVELVRKHNKSRIRICYNCICLKTWHISMGIQTPQVLLILLLKL